MPQAQSLELIQCQNHTFFERIRMTYAAFPEYQELMSLSITEEKNTTTLHIQAKEKIQEINTAFGIKGKHLA